MRGGHNKIRCKYDGIEYKSLKDLQDAIGITYQSIGKAIRNGHRVKGKEITKL